MSFRPGRTHAKIKMRDKYEEPVYSKLCIKFTYIGKYKNNRVHNSCNRTMYID